MRGHIDKITQNSVHGWALDPLDASTPLEVRISLDTEVLGTTTADLMRPDLPPVMNTSGLHGFQLILNEDSKTLITDPKKVSVHIRNPKKTEWIEIKSSSLRRARNNNARAKKYTPGDITSLRLDLLLNTDSTTTPLKNKSILDLSPNCAQSIKNYIALGASQITCLSPPTKQDSSEQVSINFINSLEEVMNLQFDTIVATNVIHKILDPLKFLKDCSILLKPQGTLILEYGSFLSSGKKWTVITTEKEMQRFPSTEILSYDLLKDFAFRPVYKGECYNLTRIERTIFHCTHSKSTALLIAGESRDGKTTLARRLSSLGCPCVNTDSVIAGIIDQTWIDDSPLTKVVQEVAATHTSQLHLGEIGLAIVKANLQKDFAKLLAMHVPTEADIFAIEGEILTHATVMTELLHELGTAGIKTWTVSLKHPH